MNNNLLNIHEFNADQKKIFFRTKILKKKSNICLAFFKRLEYFLGYV